MLPGMSLLTDLRKVAVSPSELPLHTELLNTVGALLKVLEHAGIQVADELIPAPVQAALAPAATALEALPPVHAELQKVTEELSKLKAALGLSEDTAAPTGPAPAAPAADTSTEDAAPAAPPIEGAS